MNVLLTRKFDPNYNIREHLPKEKGIEAKTNTAPMQRFVWANGLGVITKGLTEYEVYKNTLAITLLRSTGIISNPKILQEQHLQDHQLMFKVYSNLVKIQSNLQ